MRILYTASILAPNPEPLLENIQKLEDRVRSLEQAPRTEKPTVPLGKITIDPEAFKKTLLAKMWKYLHDEPGPRTI